MPVYAKGYVQRCKKWDASYLILVLRSVPPTFSHVQNHSCSDIKEPPRSPFPLRAELRSRTTHYTKTWWSGHHNSDLPFGRHFASQGHTTQDMLVSVIRSGFRNATDVVFRRGWFSETARYTPMISMRNLISYKVNACCKRCDAFLSTNLNSHLLFITLSRSTVSSNFC